MEQIVAPWRRTWVSSTRVTTLRRRALESHRQRHQAARPPPPRPREHIVPLQRRPERRAAPAPPPSRQPAWDLEEAGQLVGMREQQQRAGRDVVHDSKRQRREEQPAGQCQKGSALKAWAVKELPTPWPATPHPDK